MPQLTFCSPADTVLSHFEGLLESVVRVAADEVLQEQFRVSEVAGVVLEALSVGTAEGLLKVGRVPDPPLHVLRPEHVLALLDELVSAHLHVLIEQIAAQDLLSVLVVDSIVGQEHETESGLGDKLHVLVVEENVVVVQEEEGSNGGEGHVAFVVGILNVEVSHIIVPLAVVGIQEHGAQREAWAHPLAHIQQVEHLLDGVVAGLTHASKHKCKVRKNFHQINKILKHTCGRASCHR